MTNATTTAIENTAVAPVAMVEVAPVAMVEVAPVAMVEVAPVAMVEVSAEKVKVSKAVPKIAHAACSFNHSDLKEILAGNNAALKECNIEGPLSYGWVTGKVDELSDNNLKLVGNAVDYEMVVVMVARKDMEEFNIIANHHNQGFLDNVSDLADAADAAKNSKKVEAAAAAAQKAIEKEAKVAQKIIDDAAKAEKKAAAALAKEQEVVASPVIESDTLDVSGLFVGEEIVAPVATAPVIEADPILAAALAAAQVNANMQAYADTPIETSHVDAPVAMAAE